MGAQWVRPENPEDFEATYKLPSFSGVFTNSSQVHGSFQNGEIEGPKDYQVNPFNFVLQPPCGQSYSYLFVGLGSLLSIFLDSSIHILCWLDESC